MVYKFPNDNTAIRSAVNQWCDDKTAAEAKYGHISTWDVSAINSFSRLACELTVCKKAYEHNGMVAGTCEGFNEDISMWDVSNGTDFSYAFAGCSKFDQPIGKWDVSKATAIWSMFDAATIFNQPLNDWGPAIGQMESLSSVFRLAKAFDQPLDKWDTSNVVSLRSTFHSAAAFNQDISMWDTGKVTEMKNTFAFTDSFDQPLNWDVSSVVRMEHLFLEANGLRDCTKSLIYPVWSKNPLFMCKEDSAEGRHTCSVGHGTMGSCEGCGDYGSWADKDCSPSMPPSQPTPWIEEQWPTVTIIAGAVLVVGIFTAWICRIHLRRKRAAARERARREAYDKVFREQCAFVMSGLHNLPISTYQDQTTVTELTSTSGPNFSVVSRSASTPEVSASGSTTPSVVDSIKGFFSPTNSDGGNAPAEPAASASAVPSTAASEGTTTEAPECPICMEPFRVGDELRELPCGHKFKKACIDSWLQREGKKPLPARLEFEQLPALPSCPLCKQVPVGPHAPRAWTCAPPLTRALPHARRTLAGAHRRAGAQDARRLRDAKHLARRRAGASAAGTRSRGRVPTDPSPVNAYASCGCAATQVGTGDPEHTA